MVIESLVELSEDGCLLSEGNRKPGNGEEPEGNDEGVAGRKDSRGRIDTLQLDTLRPSMSLCLPLYMSVSLSLSV